MPDFSSKSALAGQVGSSYAMLNVSPDVTLVLEEVEDLAQAPDRDDCFMLTFRGPGHLQIPQAIYRLRDAAGDEDEVFLVPFALDADGLRLQAVLNRLTLEDLRELTSQR